MKLHVAEKMVEWLRAVFVVAIIFSSQALFGETPLQVIRAISINVSPLSGDAITFFEMCRQNQEVFFVFSLEQEGSIFGFTTTPLSSENEEVDIAEAFPFGSPQFVGAHSGFTFTDDCSQEFRFEDSHVQSSREIVQIDIANDQITDSFMIDESEGTPGFSLYFDDLSQHLFISGRWNREGGESGLLEFDPVAKEVIGAVALPQSTVELFTSDFSIHSQTREILVFSLSERKIRRYSPEGLILEIFSFEHLPLPGSGDLAQPQVGIDLDPTTGHIFLSGVRGGEKFFFEMTAATMNTEAGPEWSGYE